MARAIPGWLTSQPLAHRGLHAARTGLVENTQGAFAAALHGGYGIELDVQLSRDGEAIVFHDLSVERLSFAAGAVGSYTADDLAALPLRGTEDRIPTLKAVLAEVAGRAPLLIELKSFAPRPGPLDRRVADLLEDYAGPFAVQSFNPRSVGWFAKHRPTWIRGQLGQRYRGAEFPQLSAPCRFALTHMLFNGVSRPDFIAFDWSALPAPAPGLARRLNLPVIAWTVKSAEDWTHTKPYADNFIFEGFTP